MSGIGAVVPGEPPLSLTLLLTQEIESHFAMGANITLGLGPAPVFRTSGNARRRHRSPNWTLRSAYDQHDWSSIRDWNSQEACLPQWHGSARSIELVGPPTHRKPESGAAQ